MISKLISINSQYKQVQKNSSSLLCTMGLTSIFPTLLIVIATTMYYGVQCMSNMREENCETLPSEINIIKEEYDELGRLQRTCHSEIAVNKCEGTCNSHIEPAVNNPTGFLKECYCCRESFLRERVVTLTHCYDPDGMRLTDDENQSMDIKLKEPSDCKCFKCGDFSR